MAKEVLFISLKKVAVDYEFRNDTAEPVTIEIAFPIPAYDQGLQSENPAHPGFDDFKLAIDGKPFPFATEIKAKVKGKDVSDLLRRDGIDIATFGHMDDSGVSLDLKKATPEQRRDLIASGTFGQNKDAVTPRWKVEKRFHWTQTFPARAVVHIHHEYTPVTGSQLLPTDLLAPTHKVTRDERYALEDVTSMCISPGVVRGLGTKNGMLETHWVDFILTTANTWKQPIEDFTLIVERSDPRDTVSFCWDGPVAKLDANRFQAHVTNLIPTRELHIGFYQVLPAR